jgi:hypothetical protein
MLVSGDFPAPFGFFFTAITAIILIAAWVILAGSRFVQGGVVERPERVPQLYGYTVCLIGLIWALASVISIVDATLSLSAPELRSRNDFGVEASVTSFEAFRLSYDQQRRFSAPNPNDAKLDSIPEAELRRRYESLREDRIHRGRFEARRQIVVSALSLVIALALFAFHWRWLRRYAVVQPV